MPSLLQGATHGGLSAQAGLVNFWFSMRSNARWKIIEEGCAFALWEVMCDKDYRKVCWFSEEVVIGIGENGEL